MGGGGRPWRPKNSDGRYSGFITLRQALTASKNMVSIRIVMALGVHEVHQYVQRFGFNARQIPDSLSMALGSGVTTPLQMAQAYAVFANGGYKPLTYINHWKNGDLGIKVDETGNPGVEPESAYFMMDNSVSSLFYDYTASLSPTGVRIHGSNRVSAGFNGSPHNDVIFTGNGPLHYVIAGGGKDYIQGGTGREVILGGANNPDLQNDDDTIYGGGNTDTILGGAGNDTLWADDGTDSYETPVNANGDWRGDWVSGQYGSDAIFGSARKDMLFGGEGHDTIRGGAGDDLILGDANYTPNSRYLLLGKARQPHWQAGGAICIY